MNRSRRPRRFWYHSLLAAARLPLPLLLHNYRDMSPVPVAVCQPAMRANPVRSICSPGIMSELGRQRIDGGQNPRRTPVCVRNPSRVGRFNNPPIPARRDICPGRGIQWWMFGGRAAACKMEPSASRNKRTVFELTRRLDRGMLRAMGHGETEGGKPEPSERRNDGRRFGNGRVIGPRREVEQVYSYTGTQWDLETAVCYYRHRVLSQPAGKVREQGSGGA